MEQVCQSPVYQCQWGTLTLCYCACLCLLCKHVYSLLSGKQLNPINLVSLQEWKIPNDTLPEEECGGHDSARSEFGL